MVVVVVGAQWGDEGKGKVVDILSEYADCIVRYQGGNNAGHTVVIGEEKIILHLLPTGILHPGKTCVIANGVVVDPEVLLEEIETVRSRGYFKEDTRLLVSDRAHLIFPYHRRLDAVKEKLRGSGRIGTTGRGIGPSYEDKIARCGIRCGDLLREEIFRAKLKANLSEKNHYFIHFMNEKGYEFYEIYNRYMELGERLKGYIGDTSRYLNDAIKAGKSVLFEGAQGTLLDIDHGTYPYVTSSNTVSGGVCTGAGIGPTMIDKVIGISKAYTTRVGEGPFPTELKGEEGRRLRDVGLEYGATTGRPRRCGWLDIVALRYAVRVNGLSGVVITKLDVLSGLDKVYICTAYEYEGERIEDFPGDLHILNNCTPVYEEMDGWKDDLSGVRSFDDLPSNARRYIRRIEELIETEVIMISFGARRREALILKNPFEG